MKKIIIVLLLLGLLVGTAFAQVDYAEYEDAFQDFATGVAEALPFNATLGLDWSSAYLGNLPHFGVGITAGASTLPYEAVAGAFDALGIALPDELDQFRSLGVPFPAVALNARLGGLFLPFDVGFKAGFIPTDAQLLLPFPIDYLMLGGDVRYAVLKGKGLLPALSVGVGYTYLRGGVTMEDAIAGQGVDITPVMDSVAPADTYVLTFTNPDVNFNWQAHVIEAKVQVSKNLFIITPYLGLGAAYGISSVGGGLQSSIDYTTNGGPDVHTITPADIEAIKAAFATAGYDAPEISADGFLVSSGVEGWSVRAFGGLSFNLFVLKLDLTGGYNFLSDSLSLAANARIQL